LTLIDGLVAALGGIAPFALIELSKLRAQDPAARELARPR
jgi:hypothetical protein